VMRVSVKNTVAIIRPSNTKVAKKVKRWYGALRHFINTVSTALFTVSFFKFCCEYFGWCWGVTPESFSEFLFQSDAIAYAICALIGAVGNAIAWVSSWFDKE